MIPSSPMILPVVLGLLLGGLAFNATAATAAAPGDNLPAIIPSPQKMEVADGNIQLGNSSRILFSDASLEPLAKIFADEVHRAYSLQLTVAADASPADGDIVLTLTKAKSRPSADYSIHVTNHAALESATYDGVALATVTLLQSMQNDGGTITLPKMTITDGPVKATAAAMDIKNQWHTVEQLEQLIDLCRFYKVRYALFHTGAPQWLAATLDSTERIPEKTRREYRLYTKAEMDGLIAYGKARGVHLFPHNESDPFPGELGKVLETDFTPGDDSKGWVDEIDHQGAFTAGPDYIHTPRFREFLIKVAQLSLKQFAAGYDDGVLPFYHIGPVLGEGGATPEQAKHMIEGLLQVSPKTKILFWNGIDPNDPLLAPLKDKLVVCFYTQGFGGGGVTAHLEDGWNVLNCAWSPLYIVDQSSGRHIARTQEQVFNDWNLYRLGEDGYTPRGFDYNTISWIHFDKPQWHDQLIGAMLCTWELHPDMHFNLLRPRLPAYMEHAWNPGPWPYPAGEYAQFAARFAKTDALLQRMMFGFNVTIDGNVNRNQLAGVAKVSLTPTATGTVVRYTTDESPVVAASPVYAEPIVMEGAQPRLNARAFDALGKPVGDEWTLSLLQFPITASITEQGKVRPASPVNESILFKDDITVTLTNALPGTIHYVLGDADPAPDSPAYDKPLAIHDSTRLRAQLFGPDGQRIGRPYDVLISRTTPIPNLTLNKPVTVSTGEDKAKFAVDGKVNLDHFWDVNDGPQWLTVDLEQVHRLGEIDLYTYWDGGRYYQFFIEVSKDGKNWQEVADMRNNTTKATDQGYRCKFEPVDARYIRATLTKNSANPGLHIVELRAFEAK